MADVPNRIQQGADGQERLFTVRPRNAHAVTEKRGTVSSIRFILPSGADETKWLQTVPQATRIAFEQAITKEEGKNGFINFIAQSVSYDIQEKSQVMHTFGGQEAVYFFGRAPINVTFSGLLVDDLDNDQFCKFLQLYYDYLRGSKASQDFCYVELSLNNATFTGAFTGISVQQSSDRDTDITFSAQFLAKTFTLASTDKIFMDNEKLNQPVVMVREVDPSITQEAITATVDANFKAQLVAAKNESSADASSSDTPGALSLGDYTRSFGTLPSISDLIGFDASDVINFFGDASDFLSNITKPIQDVANQVDSYANEIISLVEGVEKGVDTLINNVESASNAVYGAIDSVEDMWSTAINFPESLVSKFAHIGNTGGASIAGSESISSQDALASLAEEIPAGAARGTPEGDLALGAMNGQASTQTPGSSADTVPGLTPS